MEQRPSIDPEELWRAREPLVRVPHDARWFAAQFGDDREAYARAKAVFMRERFDAAGVD